MASSEEWSSGDGEEPEACTPVARPNPAITPVTIITIFVYYLLNISLHAHNEADNEQQRTTQ